MCLKFEKFEALCAYKPRAYKKKSVIKKKWLNSSKILIFFPAFETELLLRPNLGASRDAPDAPSHTSMGLDGSLSMIKFRMKKK